MVQKLVLPFGRLNYVPLEQQFMPCLERILAREAGVAPLATVNILMSLCQLQCLPFQALHFVFSPGFINHISGAQTWGAGCILQGRGAGESRSEGLHPSKPRSAFPTGTPHALIVRRYLSLLDTAVELELPGYRGTRLPRRQQVPIFPQPLITDRARCKYRWVGSWGREGGGKGLAGKEHPGRQAWGTLSCLCCCTLGHQKAKPQRPFPSLGVEVSGTKLKRMPWGAF